MLFDFFLKKFPKSCIKLKVETTTECFRSLVNNSNSNNFGAYQRKAQATLVVIPNYLSDVFRKQEYRTSKLSCNTDNVGGIHFFLLVYMKHVIQKL